MPDNSVYGLLPLNSPSKKVNKKDSYINGFESIITQIFPRETHVKPVLLDYDWIYNLFLTPTQ